MHYCVCFRRLCASLRRLCKTMCILASVFRRLCAFLRRLCKTMCIFASFLDDYVHSCVGLGRLFAFICGKLKGCRSLGYRFAYDAVVGNTAHHPDLRSRLCSAGSQLPNWEKNRRRLRPQATSPRPKVRDRGNIPGSGPHLRYHGRVAEHSSATMDASDRGSGTVSP